MKKNNKTVWGKMRGTLKRSERITELTFISPSIIGVLIFFILPFFVVIYYSLIDNPINAEFVFLDNFSKIFQNEAFQLASKKHCSFFGYSCTPGSGFITSSGFAA